jgi:hypothetical protein
MLQLLMAAQKGQLKKEEGEDVGTIGEDDADSELHKKHMASKKEDALSMLIIFFNFFLIFNILCIIDQF